MSNNEEERDNFFTGLCRKAQLAEKTRQEYGARALKVIATTGMALGRGSLIRYFRLHSHLAASTLRGVKSAVLFVMEIAGDPMGAGDSRYLDTILDGLECAKGEPERVRGAPTPSQLETLYKEALEEDHPEMVLAIAVAVGVGCRAHELEGLTAGDFDDEPEVLWVPRKARMLTKVRRGYQIDKPIYSEDALRVRRHQVKVRPTGRLFRISQRMLLRPRSTGSQEAPLGPRAALDWHSQHAPQRSFSSLSGTHYQDS
jgi:integrase